MGFILNKPHGINLNDIHSKINNKFEIYLDYSGWTKNQRLEEIRDNYWKINKNYSKIFLKDQ